MKDIEKYFRVYAEVNLDAIIKNIEMMREKIKPETGIVGVIKTDGYGHGAVPIAKALENECVGYAVATAWEGHGIDKPLYILGVVPENLCDLVINEEMLPPIFTYKMAKAFSDHAVKLNKTVKFNIAVDTGMSRIGYIPSEEAVNEVVEISKLPNVEIESAFTHFAKADEKDKTFTKKQIREFEYMTKMLKENGVTFEYEHCSNSAAIIDVPEAKFDIVRAGISTFGLYPSEEVDKEAVHLKPALALKSHVAFVKEIEPGTPVSYGGTFVADKKMKIATIPVGYGDGYPRALSGVGHVLIRGKKAPILGRICMDQFMVDVTHIEDASFGDKVTLIGRDGNEYISVEMLGDLSGRFNYEFICDLGKRIPRVYVKNGKIAEQVDYFA